MCKNICFMLIVFSMSFLINSNSSNAFKAVETENLSAIKTLTMDKNYDSECNVHIKKTIYNKSKLSMDKGNLKKAALIGAVFGIRFAIGPKEIRRNNKASVGVWTIEGAKISTRKAMAITAFRKCKNEKYLEQLSSSRN